MFFDSTRGKEHRLKIDKIKYVEKVTELLNTDNFKELSSDRTKNVEESIQLAL